MCLLMYHKFFMHIFYTIKTLLVKAISWSFRIIPLQNIIVFNSFKGKGMADDPKYIALELLRRNIDVKMIWLVNDVKKADLPAGIQPVRIHSIKTCFYMSIAKVWISNCRDMSSKAMKRKGQYYIQTWHATLGLKVVGEENTKSRKVARKHAIEDSKYIDLMYSNNNVYLDLYQQRFWYNGPVIKCDLPHVAYILHHPYHIKNEISEKLGIPADNKIALYAPTFRDHDYEKHDVYDFNFERIISALERRFGGTFNMLIRLHPNLRNSHVAEHFLFNERVIDATFLPDMHELLGIVDILFTDYSSSMFDGAIANKPVLLIAKDINEYTSCDRELFFNPYKELPFTLSESEDELIAAIEDYDEIQYKQKCIDFFKRIGLVDNGNGDKILADIVMSKMN